MKYTLFLSAAKGLEQLLEEEMLALGVKVEQATHQGVYVEANLAELYRLCIETRLASRIQLLLLRENAKNEQEIYQRVYQYPWHTVFMPHKTLFIEFHGTSQEIRNTMYGAQRVKDAIVDYFQQYQGQRPSIDKEKPEVRLHAYLHKGVFMLSLDLVGYGLHQRGYRMQAGKAPLKETLAAAMLLRSHWPTLASEGYALYDPFCGSGTLVIEAAMMAAGIAPGLLRQDQAVVHWVEHDALLWEDIRAEALRAIKPVHLCIMGSDQSASAIEMAKANAKRARVDTMVQFSLCTMEEAKAPAAKGLLVCNPPYGERWGELSALFPLYQRLGICMATHFPDWEASILTAHSSLAKAVGLRSHKQYALYNGAIACALYRFRMEEKNRVKHASPESLSSGATMLANRLKKNWQHLQKWAKRNQIEAFRLYDADLPEYAFAVDIYQDYAVLQEYKAPSCIPLHKAEQRRLEFVQALPLVLPIAAEKVVLKERQPQKGKEQYQKLAYQKKRIIVQEGEARFLVNLHDYLDTGLFLDHRILRLQFAKLEKGTRFLNCFCYTATASVHAALAGAITTNVDLSNTYLQWAQDNFNLNKIDTRKHLFLQEDVLVWLVHAREKFDVIFFDPPSFSNSKRMQKTLDIERDQEELLQQAMRLLAPQGRLYFSTNRKKFRISPRISELFQVQEITQQTLDVDFSRYSPIHQCYCLTKIP